jgi:hypothetical protein
MKRNLTKIVINSMLEATVWSACAYSKWKRDET